MKAILKDGTTRQFSGAEIKDISVSILDDIIIIVLYGDEVLFAKSLHAKE